MIKKLFATFASFLVGLIIFWPGRAIAQDQNHIIIVRDPFIVPSYFPQGISINEGDTVTWVWDGANVDDHDVIAGNLPNEEPASYQSAFHSPLAISGITYQVRFDRDFLNTYPTDDNIYRYYCDPHWTADMVGSIHVNRVSKNFITQLTDSQVVPTVVNAFSGNCQAVLSADETEIQLTCTHNVSNASSAELRIGSFMQPSENIICANNGSSPANFTCPLNIAQANNIWDGNTHILIKSPAFPQGAIRGQIVRSTGNGDILGRVSLAGGQGLSSVLVEAGNYSAVTDSSGNFRIFNVPNGFYQLSATRPGYLINPNPGTSPLLVNNMNLISRNFTAAFDNNSFSGTDTDGDCIPDAQEIIDGSNPNDRGSFRDHIRSPVYVLWNGFIGLINILELVNRGDTNLPLNVSLYNIQGVRVHQQPLLISPKNQIDLIINDMPGFVANSYGLVTIEFSAEFNDALDGRMFFYRGASDFTSFEFAFGTPFVPPTCGTSYVGFNTFQPSRFALDSNNLVAQWLSIVNLDQVNARNFTVKRFNQAGEFLLEQAVSVPPFGRIDIDGGHINPGPTNVGLNEIIPQVSNSPYIAQLYRYGGDAPPGITPDTYSFAFPLLARAGNGQKQFVNVTGDRSAENWVEITNTLAQSVAVDVKFYRQDGILVNSRTINLAPRAQQHIFATELFQDGEVGIAELLPNKSEAIIGQSMFYYRDIDKFNILGMYGSQFKEPLGNELFGSYNLFLNFTSWLSVANTRSQPTQFTLTVYGPGAPVVQTINLPPHGRQDFGLHQQVFNTVANSYGVMRLQTNNPASLHAELIRKREYLRSDQTLAVDFVAPTAVR